MNEKTVYLINTDLDKLKVNKLENTIYTYNKRPIVCNNSVPTPNLIKCPIRTFRYYTQSQSRLDIELEQYVEYIGTEGSLNVYELNYAVNEDEMIGKLLHMVAEDNDNIAKAQLKFDNQISELTHENKDLKQSNINLRNNVKLLKEKSSFSKSAKKFSNKDLNE